MNNLILVLNCGSSSIKFSILNPKNKKIYFTGLVERLFLSDTSITWTDLKKKQKKIIGSNINHTTALNFIIDDLLSKQKNILKHLIGVGHRVVHGGSKIQKSILVDDNVIHEIKCAIDFAPLHNPANLIGIQTLIAQYPHLSNKNVAVFDTSFYQRMPETSFLYAIPYNFYKKYGIRRYGAHGISHNYVAYKTAMILDKKFSLLNVITCHLGNGASVSAIVNGVCVDTSMGLTPLEGLVMGTRCGDLDPAIIFYMYKKLHMSIQDIELILTKKSGLLGISGISSDFRYFEKKYYVDKEAKRSVDVFCHRLSKYISAYISLMKYGLDALVFTGGIGENVPLVRELTVSKLSLLNLKINVKKNASLKNGLSGLISLSDSIPIFVIKTDEEMAIAEDTLKIINKN